MLVVYKKTSTQIRNDNAELKNIKVKTDVKSILAVFAEDFSPDELVINGASSWLLPDSNQKVISRDFVKVRGMTHSKFYINVDGKSIYDYEETSHREEQGYLDSNNKYYINATK